MKSALTVCMVCLVCLSGLAVAAAAQGEVTADPAAIVATLPPGETEHVKVTVFLPDSMPKGDVVFAFDTTGSMDNILGTMKTQGIYVMGQIREAIPDTRFGAASFMDYNKTYKDYWGYTCSNMGGPCIYGEPTDYPYLQDQDLTDNIDTVSSAINGMRGGGGGDLPEDYTRAIYESQFFNWSDRAKKILIVFGDAPPHAAPSGTSLLKPWEDGLVFTEDRAPYGGDPGRDEIAYTPDDLDYGPVLADIAARNIHIVAAYCPESGFIKPDAESNFEYMAYVTNGSYVLSDSMADGSLITSQVISIIQTISTRSVGEFSLRAVEDDYQGWVFTPDVFTDVAWPSSTGFNVSITPPAGTADGDYLFHLNAVGDGVVLATVPVTVHVSAGQVVVPAEVSIDIKPGSCPNSFNPKEKGVLPVAILGSRDLKASSIDPKSIVLSRDGGATGVKPTRTSLEDVSSASTKTCSCGFKSGRPDRNKDLSLKFDSQELVKQLGIREGDGCVKVTITGTLRSSDPQVAGQPFTGSDYLRVIGTGHGSCGTGDKEKKGSCDDKGGSCDRNGGSCDKDGSCDGKGSPDGRASADDGNPWDDGPASMNHGHGNGQDSRT